MKIIQELEFGRSPGTPLPYWFSTFFQRAATSMVGLMATLRQDFGLTLEEVSIAGKACELGDMLIWDIELPKLRRKDILARETYANLVNNDIIPSYLEVQEV